MMKLLKNCLSINQLLPLTLTFALDVRKRIYKECTQRGALNDYIRANDEDAVYLCHDYNSVITGHNFDKHQCQERITCPDCYIFHTPEDYADHTCTNERRSQLNDEPPTKKAKDIITCSGCNKVFNTLDDYADHPCMSRSTPLTGTEPLTAVPLTGRNKEEKEERGT